MTMDNEPLLVRRIIKQRKALRELNKSYKGVVNLNKGLILFLNEKGLTGEYFGWQYETLGRVTPEENKMNDIQRYKINWVFKESDNGDFVLHSDHIASKESWIEAHKLKCEQYAVTLRSRHEAIEANLKLQQRLAEAQARVDELLNEPMTNQYYNQIKAEGIRELTNKLFPYNPDDPYEHLILLEQIEDYIAKMLLNKDKQDE